jgi:hypothetical protein
MTFVMLLGQSTYYQEGWTARQRGKVLPEMNMETGVTKHDVARQAGRVKSAKGENPFSSFQI